MKTLRFPILLGFWSVSATAQADEAPFSIGTSTQHYISAGVTTGASFSGRGNGALLGFEGSYVQAHKGKWMGIYTDALYDFGQGLTTISVGPEIGMLMFGVDAGVGLRMGAEQEAQLGAQGRVMCTLGFFALSFRHGLWPQEGKIEHVSQLGLTFKIPVALNYPDKPIVP